MNDGEARRKVLETMHASTLGGHSGQMGCFQMIKAIFYWPGLKQEVIEFVRR